MLLILFVERVSEIGCTSRQQQKNMWIVGNLNVALLSCCRLKISLSNTFRNLEPQSITHPPALLLHRSHSDILLWACHIRKHYFCPQICACSVPLPSKLLARKLEPEQMVACLGS